MNGKKVAGGSKRRSVYSSARYLLGMIWREDRTLLVMILAASIASVVIPLLGVYLPKLVLSLLENGTDAQTLLLRVGGFVLLLAAVRFLGGYAGGNYYRMNSLRDAIKELLFLKTLEIDYSELESPEGQARYHMAGSAIDRGDGSATSRMIPAISQFFTGFLGLFAYSALLATLHPLIVLGLVISALLVFAVMQHYTNYQQQTKDENARQLQRLMYLSNTMGNFSIGKDVRLYNFPSLFNALLGRQYAEKIAFQAKRFAHFYPTQLVNAAVALLRDGFAYIYLIWMVLGGGLAVSDFVFYFGLIAGFSGWMTSMLAQLSMIRQNHLDVLDIRDYLEQPSAQEPEAPAEAPDLAVAPSITFERVSFRYAKDEPPILDAFDMHIATGEKIALVGLNGAGKTTLVKLLCGFYTPEAGRILIDGTDIRLFRRKDLYRLFSSVFQDILIMPLTLAENVAMRDAGELDTDRVEHCLRAAGVWEDVQKLPQGMHSTMLKLENYDGVQLSGGQQQKLLLARALYKDAPVLILDEPSAALDPIAESALYEQYHALSSGKTSLFISHRLASTRFCDRIVFLQDGKAMETGTHDALMRQGGAYAHLFEVQSHYYKENPGEEVPS